jgi:hypothetical protein
MEREVPWAARFALQLTHRRRISAIHAALTNSKCAAPS